MSEVQKSGDQSMDDILASIRKIISSDPNDPAANVPDDVVVPKATGAETTDDLVEPAGLVDGDSFGQSHPDDLSDLLEPTAVARVQNTSGSAAVIEPRDMPSTNDEDWPFEAEDQAALSPDLQGRLAALERKSTHGMQSTKRLGEGQAGGSREGLVPTADAGGEGFSATNAAVDMEATRQLAGNTAELPVAARLDVPAVPSNVDAGASAANVSTNLDSGEAAGDGGALVAGAVALGRMIDAGGSVSPSTDANVEVVTTAPNVEPGLGAADVQSAVPNRVMQEPSPASDPISSKTRPSTSLEAVVLEALQPMLRDWIDNNLARLVDEKIETEIARRLSEKNVGN